MTLAANQWQGGSNPPATPVHGRAPRGHRGSPFGHRRFPFGHRRFPFGQLKISTDRPTSGHFLSSFTLLFHIGHHVVTDDLFFHQHFKIFSTQHQHLHGLRVNGHRCVAGVFPGSPPPTRFQAQNNRSCFSFSGLHSHLPFV